VEQSVGWQSEKRSGRERQKSAPAQPEMRALKGNHHDFYARKDTAFCSQQQQGTVATQNDKTDYSGVDPAKVAFYRWW